MSNGTAESVSALNTKLNGHDKGSNGSEEHDEEQYLDLIRKIMKKGKRNILVPT